MKIHKCAMISEVTCTRQLQFDIHSRYKDILIKEAHEESSNPCCCCFKRGASIVSLYCLDIHASRSGCILMLAVILLKW